LDTPGSNFGWLVLGDETTAGSAKKFDSRESTTAANRPALTIDYTSLATASTLALSGFPAAVTAGAAGTVTVTAHDAAGRTPTSDSGATCVDSATGQPLPGNNYPFTASDAGVPSFSVTLVPAATQSIPATDTAASTVTGSQSGIAVSPAAVDHLLVGAPDGVTAGAPFDVRVTAQDAYNNTVTRYTGTV